MPTSMTLNVQRLLLSTMEPHPRNPRVHAEPGSPEWELLKHSLQHDYFDPLVWNSRNGMLVSGHFRRKVMLAEGVVEADAVVVNYDEETHLARMIAANQQAGKDDEPALQSLANELSFGGFDMGLTGFTEERLAPLLEPPLTGDSLEDDAFEVPEDVEDLPTNVQPGDLICLGSHRLVCGDSREQETISLCLDGAEPFLMITDPPYGIEYDPEWRNSAVRSNGRAVGGRAVGEVANDDIADWTPTWRMSPAKVAYVYHAGLKRLEVETSLFAAGFHLRSEIIWNKSNFAISRSHYHGKHEPCLYVVKKNSSAKWKGGRKQSTVWDIAKNAKSETGHSTQKPLECMARPMRNHPGDVFEPFAGSGTTLIAAQHLDRVCYAVELKPVFCQVIINRFRRDFPNLPITINGAEYEEPCASSTSSS